MSNQVATESHRRCYDDPGRLYSILDRPDEDLDRIVEKQRLAENISSFKVYVPVCAQFCGAGQFVVVRGHEQGERIPLTIADFNRVKAGSPWFSRSSAPGPASLTGCKRATKAMDAYMRAG